MYIFLGFMPDFFWFWTDICNQRMGVKTVIRIDENIRIGLPDS